MSDPIIDPKVEELAKKHAKDIADAEVNKLKENLITSLTGQKPEKPPESWSSLKEETVDLAEQRILSKLEKKQEAEREEQKKQEAEKAKLTEKQTKEQQDQEWTRMSKEWTEAVQDGIIPDISEPVKQALAKDPDYQHLTPEQQADPGLTAYNEARLLHVQLAKEGKSTSFYRTIDKFYKKQPAGARAPVLGNTVATTTFKPGYTYEEVAAERRRRNR